MRQSSPAPYEQAVHRAFGKKKKRPKKQLKGPHPGFKNVQESIAARSGVSKEQAGAMLAAASRRASPAAKKKNPRLKRVRG